MRKKIQNVFVNTEKDCEKFLIETPSGTIMPYYNVNGDMRYIHVVGSIGKYHDIDALIGIDVDAFNALQFDYSNKDISAKEDFFDFLVRIGMHPEMYYDEKKCSGYLYV